MEAAMEKVKVKIQGQEYTISGDKPQVYIEMVAGYVDEKMKQLSGMLPNGSASELAALTAVNIADELFSNENTAAKMEARIEQLEHDANHYIQLWEEAKKNFLQYRDEAQRAWNEKEEVQKGLDAAETKLADLRESAQEFEAKIQVLEHKNESLAAMLISQEEERNSSQARLREIELKNKEIESSFFDLQMENIQLKGEIERRKREGETGGG
jgi:cell division protein ZapA